MRPRFENLTIDQFLLRQQDSIATEFRSEPETCLIATTTARLVRHSKVYGWSVASLNGVKPESGLVIQKTGFEPELWVRASYRGYRKAFLLFLEQFYNLQPGEIPKTLQVDHLHPSSRFTQENNHYFVRLALINRGINASYGAGFERLLYSRERKRELIGGIHMDWMAYLKARCIRLPAKLDGVDCWQIWAWQKAKLLASDGFDTIVTYESLTMMLNLAFQNAWRPLSLHPSFKSEAALYQGYEGIITFC